MTPEIEEAAIEKYGAMAMQIGFVPENEEDLWFRAEIHPPCINLESTLTLHNGWLPVDLHGATMYEAAAEALDRLGVQDGSLPFTVERQQVEKLFEDGLGDEFCLFGWIDPVIEEVLLQVNRPKSN